MHANYHTHTFRCGHATGREEEYIKNAIEGGIKILGFSDHAPFVFPDGFESLYRIPSSEAEDYFSTLRSLREKYENQIQILIGFEMEYYPLYFSDMLDYVKILGAEYLILGQHFIQNEHPNGISSFNPNHTKEQLIEYTDTVIEGMKTDKFSCVAHPDAFIYLGDDATYISEARRLCKAAKELDIPLELNFLGIYDNRTYPDERFVKIMGEVGNKVVFGFDAHNAERAFDGASLAVAKQLTEKYNLNVIPTIEIKAL